MEDIMKASKRYLAAQAQDETLVLDSDYILGSSGILREYTKPSTLCDTTDNFRMVVETMHGSDEVLDAISEQSIVGEAYAKTFRYLNKDLDERTEYPGSDLHMLAIKAIIYKIMSKGCIVAGSWFDAINAIDAGIIDMSR
jgi:hypothetical protein